ncbi:MAG TPA: hypothetical protein VKB87_27145, partial [Myxococcaceae bacterium]|nr:hypothetical protein [Myxococcaceae bacterium]
MTYKTRNVVRCASRLALATLALAIFTQDTAFAQRLNGGRKKTGKTDNRELREFIRRGDIRQLPPLLKGRLLELAARPHTFLPITAFSEADEPSQL